VCVWQLQACAMFHTGPSACQSGDYAGPLHPHLKGRSLASPFLAVRCNVAAAAKCTTHALQHTGVVACWRHSCSAQETTLSLTCYLQTQLTSTATSCQRGTGMHMHCLSMWCIPAAE
jgi:hypothetical protein